MTVRELKELSEALRGAPYIVARDRVFLADLTAAIAQTLEGHGLKEIRIKPQEPLKEAKK